MSSNHILPLKAPNPLPANGVDVVAFKVWKNTLIAHIQQDTNHHHFMPDGVYSVWRAAESGRRIGALHDEDPDRLILEGKNLGERALNAELLKLLTLRNAQLSKFITHVATLCHYTENDDVTNCSTSLDWIFTYLKKHYGIETKGANFLNISNHVFKSGTPYQTFYKQYRASFIDNLRKEGDVVKYKNEFALTADEALSPSFENAIVLWALEKIDPRLPGKVKKNYGHQMTGDVTLKDIQPIVFEHIHLLLEELEQTQQLSNAFSSQTLDEDQPHLNAFSIRKNINNRNTQIATKQTRFSGRARNMFNNRSSGRGSAGKFCRICNLAGSDARIFTSHEIGNCSRLTMRDLESLKNSLVLNGMITQEEYEPEQPQYILQPGWDDVEAEQLQETESQ